MDRLFSVTGLGQVEERVYVALVENPGATLAQVVREIGISAPDGRRAVRVLEDKGLLTKRVGRTTGLVPTAPEVAIDLLINDRQEELDRARLAARELQERFRAALTRTSALHLVEVVDGREGAIRRFVQLQRSAQREILILDKPPYWETDVNREELALLRRGITYRTVYDATALRVPGAVDEIEQYVAAGEEARTSSIVPMKGSIYDRNVALIPLSLQDADSEGALMLHASPLLEALVMLFELLWENAVPLTFRRVAKPARATEARDRSESYLLHALAAGLKDEVIAREMNVAIRTVERRTKRLMQKLGAETRFQAGLQAAKKGYL